MEIMIFMRHLCRCQLQPTVLACQEVGESLVHGSSEISSVVHNHVQWLAIREHQGLLNAPDVLLVCLSLPGIDRDATGSNGSGGIVVSGEDVSRTELDL